MRPMMIGKDDPSVVLRVWLFGEWSAERRLTDGTWEPILPEQWGPTRYPRSLFLYLLCHGRTASRETIMEQLWTRQEELISDKNVSNAASYVRHVLSNPSLLETIHARTTYKLADQSQIWTDADRCDTLMQEIEQIGNVKGLPLLEEAAGYFERGPFLERESALWCHWRREQLQTAKYRCLIWLADAYEQQGELRKAEIQVEKILKEYPKDENAFAILMRCLQKQGMKAEAFRRYEQLQMLYKHFGVPFPKALQKLAKDLQNTSIRDVSSPPLSVTGKFVLSSTSSVLDIAYVPSRFSEPETLDSLQSRRQVLQTVLNTACTTLTLSPYMSFHLEDQERIEKAILKPSRIDDNVLDDLTSITKAYWRLCAKASIDILSSLSGHFMTITQLLKTSHTSSIYQQLCSLIGENAQILGKTLYDIHEYDLAWRYYSFSLKAACEAHNTNLWATGLGRMSLLLIYCGQPQTALSLLQDSRTVMIQNIRIQAWIAAIEAEIHAALGNADGCIRALERSNGSHQALLLDDDIYFTGFNPSRQAGYEGACLVRLHQPQRALSALQRAIDLIEPTATRRRATLLTDMSAVYAQLGAIQNACAFAFQALDITMQTKSLSTLQRISRTREELEPWKHTEEVQKLDTRLSHALVALTRMKEMV